MNVWECALSAGTFVHLFVWWFGGLVVWWFGGLVVWWFIFFINMHKYFVTIKGK
jgi:hypothetical protein